MQKLKVMMLVAAWWCGFASNPAFARTKATFSFHISPQSSEVSNGADVVILDSITNISDHDIKYGGEVGIEPFNSIVRDEQGNPVKETKYGMKVHDSYPHQGLRFASHFYSFLIKKGGTVSDKIMLGKEYDLSAPGVYSVYLTQMDGETAILVKSNTVHFTVLPK